MNMDPEQLKKLKVRYLKCSKGDLHEGEVLNFICIDPACHQKGLICPVCQAHSHQGHQTLHLKVFLAQIGQNLGERSELAGIGGYLASLDQTRREISRSLRETVEQLSHKIREVEDKIEKTYSQLRKTILSQVQLELRKSTVSLRLPELYRLLTDTSSSQDETQIIKEITRYSELLEFKNNKLIVVDSSKDLVAEYQSKAGMLGAHLTTVVAEVSKIFGKLPLTVDIFGGQKEEEKKGSEVAFSGQQKSAGVNVFDGKAVKLEESSVPGIAFLTGDFHGKSVQKASFKIADGGQGQYISIGVANPDLFQETNYEVNLEANPNIHGLCSFGILTEDLEGQGFIYSKGDTVDVIWQPEECKLTLSRRHSIQKCEVTLPVEEGGKMSFFVALVSEGTRVELVE